LKVSRQWGTITGILLLCTCTVFLFQRSIIQSTPQYYDARGYQVVVASPPSIIDIITTLFAGLTVLSLAISILTVFAQKSKAAGNPIFSQRWSGSALVLSIGTAVALLSSILIISSGAGFSFIVFNTHVSIFHPFDVIEIALFSSVILVVVAIVTFTTYLVISLFRLRHQ